MLVHFPLFIYVAVKAASLIHKVCSFSYTFAQMRY